MDDNWETVAYPASALSAVTISFDYELTPVTPQLPVACLLQSNDDEEGGISPLVAENGLLDPSLIKVEGNNIILDLSGLADGTWFIEIPAGFAKIAELEGTFTNVVEFSYVIKDGLGYPEVIAGLQINGQYTTSNMPEYAIVTWNYSNIELSGEGVVTVEIENMINFQQKSVELPASAVVLRYIEPAQEGGEPEPLTRADEEVYNALEINFGEYLPEIEVASWVSIVLPEGFVTGGEFVNDKAFVTIDVYPVYPGNALFVNEEGVVSVYWDNLEVGVNMDVDPAFVTDTEGNVIELTYGSPWDEDVVPDITEKINEDWMFEGLEVYLDNLDLEDGNYTLWIPMGYVTILAEDYSAMWYNNTAFWQFSVEGGVISGNTSGIDTIETVKTVDGVYNLQGVKMGNDLNTLTPGLYIVNGKKVLVRK